jgi:hypothetical protein
MNREACELMLSIMYLHQAVATLTQECMPHIGPQKALDVLAYLEKSKANVDRIAERHKE